MQIQILKASFGLFLTGVSCVILAAMLYTPEDVTTSSFWAASTMAMFLAFVMAAATFIVAASTENHAGPPESPRSLRERRA